jgi:hypothetical protein
MTDEQYSFYSNTVFVEFEIINIFTDLKYQFIDILY